ncbi:MAG: solute:sodium symporter family transporter [Planctomycetaceae bacterium]|nr:solute:sodium symporter family transporter [Planctomycetaceae bacterium]
MAFITIGSFVFFTALVGLLTYRLTRKDDHGSSIGYFLAGRRLTGGYIAGSLMLTNLSTEQLVGLNGAAFTDGISVMAWEVLAGLSLVAMGLFFLPRYLKGGIATIPELLEDRFDKTTRLITSLIFLVAYTCILLPILLYTGAVGLSGILDVQSLVGISSEQTILWIVVWMVGIIGSIYAIFGGLRTVAVSDTINGFGLFAGGVLITFLGLQAVSGGEGWLEGWRILRESNPEKFNSIGGSKQSVPFSTLFTGVIIINLFYWCTNQQIIQRALGASSLAEGQRGVMIASVLKLVAPIILVIPGIIAFQLFAADGIHPDQAYGALVREVLPGWMRGFFAAVVVGAILSSFNSALNSTATLFSLGIYKTLLNPQASQAQVIRSGKICGTVLAVAAMSTAPLLYGQDSIFGYLQKMNALYFIPIFSVVIVGLTTRRVPAAAASTALILGCVLIALGYFVPKFAGLLEPIGDFHFVGGVFLLLILLMLGWGAIRPRSTPYEQEYSGDVDLTPWRWAKPMAAMIVVVVLFAYAYFADFSILSQ